MKTIKTICLTIALFALALLLNQNNISHRTVAAHDAATESSKAAKEAFGKLPLYFLENQGQLDPRVSFYVPGREQTLYFTPQGISFALTPAHQSSQWNLQLKFVGANPHVQPRGREQAAAEFNYFTGAADEWQTGVKTYTSIVYENLWPGIDLVYAGHVNQMKYEFHVKPGADPAQIKLAYHGAESLALTAAGALEIKTPITSFNDDQPVSYQEIAGQRVNVPTAYALERTGHAYHFTLGAYDRSQPLVIDPAMLMYCGYIGGSGTDIGTDIAADKEGNAYVTGFTNSKHKGVINPFPVTVGPELAFQSDNVCGDCYDAFVAKVNKEGKLVYCGYIGGNKSDSGYGITVDSKGRAYVVGQTASTKFPVNVGPKLVKSGTHDGFIARVSADGKTLEYCGYIGGTANNDTAVDVAVNSDFEAFVVGSTDSKDLLNVMGASTSWQWTYGDGLGDAYALKIKDGGASVVYGGFIGGVQWDVGTSIDVDAKGNAYVGGYTQSDHATFPIKIGPDLTFNGSQDGFVARINDKGDGLDYCGYLGGSGDDDVSGLAVTEGGEAYLTGGTTSNNLPIAGAAADASYNGSGDAFIAVVKEDGSSLALSGYFGGKQSESGIAISLDASGNAYITGATDSDESTFPVTDGPDLTFNGTADVFVAKLRNDGMVIYCGYLGGKLEDVPWGIATDKTLPDAEAFLVGRTNSTQTHAFPLLNGPDLTFNGNGPPLGNDAFVAKISKP
jgi:hypothetical protein